MEPKEQLQSDLKEAMKNRDEVRKTTIRMALASIKNAEIEKRGELDTDAQLAIVKKEVKMRRDSIDEAEKAGREDIAEPIKGEIEILQAYLPVEMARAEIVKLATAAIEEVGAQSQKDMGNIMRVLMPQLKGKADGNLVNQVVRELLTSGE